MNAQFFRDYVDAGGKLVAVPFGTPGGLVRRFLEEGGAPERIPENLAGLPASNAFRAALARTDLRFVPDAAIEFVQSGCLTVSGARAPAVWRWLKGVGPASAWKLAGAMQHVSAQSVLRSLELLQRRSYALTVCDRPRRFVARGDEPSWADFVGVL